MFEFKVAVECVRADPSKLDSKDPSAGAPETSGYIVRRLTQILAHAQEHGRGVAGLGRDSHRLQCGQSCARWDAWWLEALEP